MVQHETTSSSSEENNSPQKKHEIMEITAKGIPVKNYRLVGWSVDTTGRRLIDEIVQISGYTPETKFSQYIMPFADLNPVYSHKHNIRIFNALRYRRLKDMRTGQFLKTKSEISALNDFVQWLETVRGDSDGVVLIYHEVRKATPGMLLEALRRNNLLERFELICKGFANGFSLTKAKCESSMKTYNLRVMGKILLGRENTDFSNATERASAIYEIAIHLAQAEKTEIDSDANNKLISTGTEPELIAMICPFTDPISAELEEIELFKVLLERQNTFRPVFGALMKSSPPERQHASYLRRLLAENNINYDNLKEAYEKNAKDGLDKVLKDQITDAKEADMTELLEILDCYFDPDKLPVKPKTNWQRYPSNRRPRPKSISNNNKNRRSISKSKKTSETKTEVGPLKPENNGSSDNNNLVAIKNEEISSSPSVKTDEHHEEIIQPLKAEIAAN